VWEAPADGARWLLLDEPTSSLDLRHQFALMKTLRRLAGEGWAIVAVLHDLHLVSRWADRCLLVRDGRLVSDGAPAEVLTAGRIEDAYELDRAEAELKLAQARLSLAQNDLARAKNLLSAKAISVEEADTRASDEKVAAATVQQAEAAVDAAKLNVEFTQVRAPIAGLISRKYVTEGNLINGGTGGTLLTTIVSLDPIYCYFEADEQSFLRYSRLEKEGLRPDTRESDSPAYLELADETGFPHKGYVDFLDNRIDTQTGTIRGRGVFENPGDILTPGLFARIKIVGSAPYEAILLPDEAVGSDQSQKFVLVVNPENTVEYRQVELGPKINGFRVIRSGVEPADRVIVKGLQRAAPGAVVNPVEEDIVVKNDNFITPGISSGSPEGSTGG